ncbi:hypothetical protein CYMTET_25515 [Cymbomonas tetramitiformis]|uniref:Vesicle transport protein n=1 Tax=Cymbomonas tetramitiformis TaxID=36881 RepID=A0AAE0KYV8_9CHLO|nr:hypothetical protein CYMTET_25515 [Cymbomonas tetramitiformis]
MWAKLTGNEPEPESMADRAKRMLGMQEEKSNSFITDLKDELNISKRDEPGFFGWTSKYTQKFQTAVGLQEEEQSLANELSQATTMSYTSRFYGFIICLVLGFALSALSWLFYFNTPVFATVYTFGNLVALSSSALFWGPKTYWSMMFKKSRWIATSMMLLMMGVTLFVVFYTHDKLLILICICVQSACLIWYTLSYIPFARSLVTRCGKSCFGSMVDDGL